MDVVPRVQRFFDANCTNSLMKSSTSAGIDSQMRTSDGSICKKNCVRFFGGRITRWPDTNPIHNLDRLRKRTMGY